MILLFRWKVLNGNWQHESTFCMKGFKGELVSWFKLLRGKVLRGKLATWFYFLDEMFTGGICNMILLFRWNVYVGDLQHNFLTKGFMGEIVNMTSSFWWMGGIWQHASAFWLKGLKGEISNMNFFLKRFSE